MSEKTESYPYWVGALAMGLAIAHSELDKGRYEAAARVLSETLERYFGSDACPKKIERRLRRKLKEVDSEESASGDMVPGGLPRGDSASGVGHSELKPGLVVGTTG